MIALILTALTPDCLSRHYWKLPVEPGEEEEAVMPSGPCKEFRMRTQRDKESKKSRGGEKEGRNGKGGGLFDPPLKCNCAIPFLLQHNEE